MYFHREAKLIYLAHPRTASNATKAALGFETFEPDTHHSRLKEAEGILFDKDTRHEWLAFTTVRNHWDTVISWIFKRFWRADNLNPPFDMTAIKAAIGKNAYITEDRMWGMHSDDADVILRYENLLGDLNGVLTSRGLPALSEIPPNNVTKNREGRHYRDFYTMELRKYVHRRFRKEIDRFGYEF